MLPGGRHGRHRPWGPNATRAWRPCAPGGAFGGAASYAYDGGSTMTRGFARPTGRGVAVIAAGVVLGLAGDGRASDHDWKVASDIGQASLVAFALGDTAW